MIYKEMLSIVKNMVKVKDDDINEENIIKNALNDAYNTFCYVDKRVTRAYTPIINGIVTLPTNFIKIVSSVPEIDNTDTIIGNSIITTKEGIIDMLYTYVREALLDDLDEPDLSDRLQYAMIQYACFKLLESRGDSNYKSYYISYNNIKDEYEEKNDTGSCFTEQVIDVCGGNH